MQPTSIAPAHSRSTTKRAAAEAAGYRLVPVHPILAARAAANANSQPQRKAGAK